MFVIDKELLSLNQQKAKKKSRQNYKEKILVWYIEKKPLNT
jgi:hypothetical protein